MLSHIDALYQHRDLLITWTLREIRVRYKQSLLGAAWAIIQPLTLMLIFTAIFSMLVHVPTEGIPYPLFAYTALLSWTFQASSVSLAIPALTNNLSLVTKVYFPREILPLASIGACLIDFLVASLLLMPALGGYGVPLSPTFLWVPVILLIQLILLVGIVLPASALMVFYRDIRFAVPLGVQLWLYMTPVIYPTSLVPEQFRLLYAMNPMVGIVDSYRRVILQGVPPVPEYLLISLALSVLLALSGYAYFKHAEGSFADLI
jgi:lipopolysaccharide transport system permease protein